MRQRGDKVVADATGLSGVRGLFSPAQRATLLRCSQHFEVGDGRPSPPAWGASARDFIRETGARPRTGPDNDCPDMPSVRGIPAWGQVPRRHVGRSGQYVAARVNGSGTSRGANPSGQASEWPSRPDRPYAPSGHDLAPQRPRKPLQFYDKQSPQPTPHSAQHPSLICSPSELSQVW